MSYEDEEFARITAMGGYSDPNGNIKMLENETQCEDPHTVETFGPLSIGDTLSERGNRYGDFNSHALITQNIKRVMQDTGNWNKLSDAQKECLEMIAHKIGRILNGDPGYKDSWHDIVGYAKLVDDEL